MPNCAIFKWDNMKKLAWEKKKILQEVHIKFCIKHSKLNAKKRLPFEWPIKKSPHWASTKKMLLKYFKIRLLLTTKLIFNFTLEKTSLVGIPYKNRST